MAERQVEQLGAGAACVGWNHCGRRLAANAVDSFVSVYDSQPSPSFMWQVTAHSDGQVKVYDLLDSLELDKWQLQCNSRQSSRTLQIPFHGLGRSQHVFLHQLHGVQEEIWEFEEAHQRWLPLVELGSSQDKGDIVHSVAWAPNIGRYCNWNGTWVV
ncbi:hypothetical protein GUJ93_ZPchr0001g29574 [Zizania palustris]|uniref:Uncharacterized protein n=1 Tax=Zizania palustris TaxID=103762 RepID=A0A8J5V334_ZIZPA|nr:hypothetical protein GUJ93_ZPchr0001g29574 [Zizania palustris]